MPKQRITKEMVVEAAFDLAREKGMEQVLVKSIAEKLGCSVQPIYSYCQSMEGLLQDVYVRIRQFIREYLDQHIDKEDFFRSTGYAYIKLAKEEPNIFKMFVLHQREGIASLDDLYCSEAGPRVAEFIAQTLHIDASAARVLHQNMLIYTVGIGTILATASPGIPAEEIQGQLENAYQAFLEQTLKGFEGKEQVHR